MNIILTHLNADFDAIASMLGAHILYPESVPVLPPRVNRNVAEFLTLYSSAFPFAHWADTDWAAVEHLILTDTQSRPDIPELSSKIPTLIIEHHAPERQLGPNEKWHGDQIGAATTLLVEGIREQHIKVNSLQATLMAMGIYEDTGMLTYGGTTSRDLRSVAWLLDQGADLNTVRRFLAHPLNDTQQDLFEILMGQTETRNIHGYPITIATTRSETYIEGINSVTMRMREMLEAVAVFVVVEMPRSTQLVCRSSTDEIDVGIIAQQFGGGGHTRAAAASIYNRNLADISTRLWELLNQNVQPAIRVRDLMSFGAQTVQADDTILSVIARIRRIGHEGYPVLDENKIVGLLTLRDADRTLEHGLDKLRVRDVMRSGEISLSPDSSVQQLEQTMVNSGWGQIPVIENDKLVGIVTRTDLIKHWAQTHPEQLPEPAPLISAERIEEVVGSSILKLIEAAINEAQENRLALYLVGGAVRDWLLGRHNLDIDFVVEGDAIRFAEGLKTQYGGSVHSYRPFGTATWLLDEYAAKAIGVHLDQIPATLDFATARNEFYTHPTALPTVYSGSIKLDLGRRDFTINTLAVQLSPIGTMWRILDFFNGLQDLQAKKIRVLHSLSFVDDPTRILRAVRFAQRLGFHLETRTRELIETALPMLRRITGERIRNELNLILIEAQPTYILSRLDRMKILDAIYPGFIFGECSREAFAHIQDYGEADEETRLSLYWHAWFACMDPVMVIDISDRLLFGRTDRRSFEAIAQLVHGQILKDSPSPSKLRKLLDEIPESALSAAHWILDENSRNLIEQYQNKWRDLRPYTTGHTLHEIGLPPGPAFRQILDHLRDGWLDGTITNQAEEEAELQRMIAELGYGDD